MCIFLSTAMYLYFYKYVTSHETLSRCISVNICLIEKIKNTCLIFFENLKIHVNRIFYANCPLYNIHNLKFLYVQVEALHVEKIFPMFFKWVNFDFWADPPFWFSQYIENLWDCHLFTKLRNSLLPTLRSLKYHKQ